MNLVTVLCVYVQICYSINSMKINSMAKNCLHAGGIMNQWALVQKLH